MRSVECDVAQIHQLFHHCSCQKPSKESSTCVTKGASHSTPKKFGLDFFTVANGRTFSSISGERVTSPEVRLKFNSHREFPLWFSSRIVRKFLFNNDSHFGISRNVLRTFPYHVHVSSSFYGINSAVLQFQFSKAFLENARLEINARKLAKCEWAKYPLANVCELESTMSPKHLERICLWSHQFASGKILLAKLCKWTEKLTSSPEMSDFPWLKIKIPDFSLTWRIFPWLTIFWHLATLSVACIISNLKS